jgi:hypothetical protein
VGPNQVQTHQNQNVQTLDINGDAISPTAFAKHPKKFNTTAHLVPGAPLFAWKPVFLYQNGGYNICGARAQIRWHPA